MKKKIGLLLLWYLSLAPTTAAWPQPDLASADWSVNAPRSLAKDPPPGQSVWEFVNHFWEESLASGELCSFRFVDLRHSGGLSLVTVYDGGGTTACNQLTIFDRNPAGIEAYDYSGSLATTDVKEVVTDINGDGRFELVAPLGAASYCSSDWPSVYSWTGNGYTNVSSQYPSYYRAWLASLKKEIAKLETERERVAQARSTPPAVNGMVIEGSGVVMEHRVLPAEPERAPSVSPEVEATSRLEIDCKQAQAAKIERFLGSKDAGMLDAMRWANSDDPGERDLATSVFVDMGTPEALRYEQTLSRDAAPKVAKRAQHDLKSWWGKVEAYYAPTFDRKLPDHPGNF